MPIWVACGIWALLVIAMILLLSAMIDLKKIRKERIKNGNSNRQNLHI